MIDSMMELLDAPDGTKPLYLADTLATDAEQANIDDQVEMEETNPLDTSDLPAETGDKRNTRNNNNNNIWFDTKILINQ